MTSSLKTIRFWWKKSEIKQIDGRIHHVLRLEEFTFLKWLYWPCSVQFSCSVMSNFLRPLRLQYAKSLCPSPTPGVYSTSCPSVSNGVSDAIQPSHPLSSPSPLAFNLSQHQGLSQWVSSSHQVAKGLEFQFKHQSFQWIFGTDFL